MNAELEKIADRIQKLLRLSKDGGATEAEAALAAEKAQEIMAEYNLTMAEIEDRGDSTGDDGKREQQSHQAGLYQWQRDLIAVLGETNYCIVSITKEWREGKHKKIKRMRNTFKVLGRAANVAAVTVTFDYLVTTMARLCKEAEGRDGSRNWDHSFSVGATERLIERIADRHRQILEEQKRQAEAHRKASPSTANAMVILEDWEQKERDLNNDFRNGWAPGKTAADRAKREAERAERDRKAEALKTKLLAEGVDPMVAYYMSQGFSRERAEELAHPKPKTAKERRAEEAAQRRSDRYWQSQSNKEWRKESRLNRSALSTGRAAADRIGLDPQIGKGSGAKKLT